MHQEVQFLIDELENFPNQPIYIHDDETDTYHEIRTTAYKVTLPQGENKTRFSLRFTDKTLAVKETAIINGNDIVISHQKNSNTLAVHNSSTDIIIQKVVLYNDWTDYQHLEGRKSIAREYSYLSKVSAGVYVAKLQLQMALSKKIIIP
jgi:hypothetical protein